MGKEKTLDAILQEVKPINDEALAEDKMLKDLEATYLDEEALKDGTLDPQSMALLYERRKLATEMRRQLIRERISMAGSEKVQFIHPRPVSSVKDNTHKRIAVYARVSTKSLDQTSSIENQTRYYKEKIAKNPNWELYRIYSDEGKSGTSKKWRPDFLQMIEDAKKQKFDMILCASVSRFARNVAECLEEITRLRVMNPSHPIGVYFETENIDTLDDGCKDSLDIQAMLAEWESRNKSRRMILSYDQRIFTCQFPVSDLLGYRHTRTGKLIMIPEEAKTVRVIFLAFFCGYSVKEIAEILTEKKRHTLRGRTDWNSNMVRNVMLNERRWGQLQARKTVVVDYKKKIIAKNDGIRESAFVEDHHVGIVSPEMARAVRYLFPNSTRIDGVQDIKVISEGSLKGFVSVNPYWNAVDNNTFLDICCSVYDEEELERIEFESRVRNGEAQSKVISKELSDYQIPYGVYFLTRTMPSVTLSKSKIKFNKACHDKFEQCRYIELLYHPIYQMLAIRACDEQTDTSICWEKEDGKGLNQFNVRAFMKALYQRMDWIEDYQFQFRGILRARGHSKILFFSLDEPKIHVGKGREPVDSTSDPIQYIKYKNKDDQEHASEDLMYAAYPMEWQNCIGLSHAMRKRRDRITENITEKDICIEGNCAINPLIGEIPTKQEAMEELEALLIEM